MSEHWTERIGEATAREALTEALPPGPTPTAGVDFAALTGRQLYAAVLSADADVKRGAQAELERRLRARGDLDVRGDIRRDKCFSCGLVFTSTADLARHHHQRPPHVLDLLTEAGVPDKAAVDAVARGALTRTQAVVAVVEWLESGTKPLVLSSAPGTGKTWAAVEAIGRHGGLWSSAHEFGRLVPDDWLESLCHASGVVVVDDLGQEHLGPRAGGLSTVDEIVKRRIERGLRLIATTNLSPEALRARYGERFWSRVEVVEVGGADLRRNT